MPDVADLVPGGILPTDHWHIETCDGTCSRCRKMVSDHEVPITIWRGNHGDDMMIFCETCTRRGPSPESGVADVEHNGELASASPRMSMTRAKELDLPSPSGSSLHGCTRTQ